MLTRKDLETAMVALDLFWGEVTDAPENIVNEVLAGASTKQELLASIQETFQRIAQTAGAMEEDTLLKPVVEPTEDLFNMNTE